MPTPANCRCSETHEWFRTEPDGTVTMGITQHAADALTDITFVQMKPAGSSVTAGGSVGEVESVKTSSEIYVPVGATVAAVNDAAHKDPSLLNSDPFGKGWLVRLSGCDLSKATGLVDAAEYDRANGH
ncbi:MAG: glycine cleavage system protein GcvH [Phycisphaerales bacterium]